MFKKILIANRGEIAVRVIRACHELGIKAVAIYSDVDRASLHVLKADEAHHIGAAAASESYLNIEKVIDVAKRSGVQAIHPGYGFLSENAKFAHACAEAGVKLIGPNAAAMELMGSKTRARQQMEKAGVPCVPGTSRGLESFGQAERVAEEIGYPLMLKAAAGGGGKGMRLVRSREELKPALESAKSEALRAFGDSEVYVRCRSWPMNMETLSISASASAPSSGGIRKFWKKRHRRLLTSKCGGVWVKLPCAWPKQPDTQMPELWNSWLTKLENSISLR